MYAGCMWQLGGFSPKVDDKSPSSPCFLFAGDGRCGDADCVGEPGHQPIRVHQPVHGQVVSLWPGFLASFLWRIGTSRASVLGMAGCRDTDRQIACAGRLASPSSSSNCAASLLWLHHSSCPAGVQDIKFLNKEQESEAKHFKDPATNVDLDVTDKVGDSVFFCDAAAGSKMFASPGVPARSGADRCLSKSAAQSVRICRLTAYITCSPASLPPPPLAPTLRSNPCWSGWPTTTRSLAACSSL